MCCEAGGDLHVPGMQKRFVYVLTTGGALPRYYVGLTSDVAARLGRP
jgi:predicted GIY-YIG superfamily endonuclease